MIVPAYYPHFSCLMGACRHSCCIGWEIDIDPDTLECYRRISGPLGEKLRECIDMTEGIAHFLLTPQERCPFLNESGLCQLILEKGPDVLCQICDDHPRFRNHFSSYTETGLGICCEAAAALILTWPEPVQMIETDENTPVSLPDAEEQALLTLRDQCIRILQNRAQPIEARIKQLSALIPAFSQDCSGWYDLLFSLERLDPLWETYLAMLREEPLLPLPDDSFYPLALEQLGVYLLFRHLPGALDDGDTQGRIAFALLMLTLISHIARVLHSKGQLNPEVFVDLCRMYSAEIEYSDENLCAILDALDASMNDHA